MQGRLEDGVVHLPGDVRQRFHDSRGYGRPADGDDLEVVPVETAYLFLRSDIGGVDGMSLRGLLTRTGTTFDLIVYEDLCDRGFYLSPARKGWPNVTSAADTDFLVYPRGESPWDGEVEHRVRVVGERESIPVSSLGETVLAIVDEDDDLAYFDTEGSDPEGVAAKDLPADFDTELLSDHALVWDGVDRLRQRGFFGQCLYSRNTDNGPPQLSLLEAAYLAHTDTPTIDEADVVSCNRDMGDDRFDRRLAVYAALREAKMVPKSGFKLGSDFHVYTEFESVDDPSHSGFLVRVVAPDHMFVPRDLSLGVRLAGGVRKRMVFMLADDNGEID